MQPVPNRLGLGLRPPLPSYGQGPSMSALAQQQQMLHQGFVPPQAHKQTTLFVGSISGGVTDAFLNSLLVVSHQCDIYLLLLPSFSRHVALSSPSNASSRQRTSPRVLDLLSLKTLTLRYDVLPFCMVLSYRHSRTAVQTRSYWCVVPYVYSSLQAYVEHPDQSR